MSVIRLLSLQCHLLKHSAARVVNLTSDEAMAFVRSCAKYSEVTLAILSVVCSFVCLFISPHPLVGRQEEHPACKC